MGFQHLRRIAGDLLYCCWCASVDVATQQFGAGQLLSDSLPITSKVLLYQMTTFTLPHKTELVAGTCLQTIGTTLTTADGLPSSNVEDIKFISIPLYIASGSG